MFTKWMGAHIRISGPGDDEDSDEEMETPHKLKKLRSPLQAWDIQYIL